MAIVGCVILLWHSLGLPYNFWHNHFLIKNFHSGYFFTFNLYDGSSRKHNVSVEFYSD